MAARIACAFYALLLRSAGAAHGQPTEPAGIHIAVRDYVSTVAEGSLLFDPRPIRTGADVVSGLDSTDLVDDTTTVAARVESAGAAGTRLSDILADKRCAFSEGIPASPGTRLSTEALERERTCRARGPFTTFAMGIATPRTGCAEAGPVRVVMFTRSSYRIWDLTLSRSADGAWRVHQAKRVFAIAS